MGDSEYILGGLNLPYVVFGSNVGGRPDGQTLDAAGNTQTYGVTPTSGTSRPDIPWAKLDSALDTAGTNLAPGYAFDVRADWRAAGLRLQRGPAVSLAAFLCVWLLQSRYRYFR
ncbi:hypothetical protein [Propionivibrio sp.]|uniref:hypothetical protein n=1 Tax=Propionivibrio sp. TaxID=2212460 RepID=UPI0026272DD4|nr:hypothetical protein [Propionivibrio sp.]